MKENKTHWKKLTNPNFIGAYSFLENEYERAVTIERVVYEKVTVQGGKVEELIVAHLKDEKPLILNKTNSKTISKLLDSPYIEDWAGKRITLFKTKVKFQREMVEALRVKNTLPVAAALPELIEGSEIWYKAKEGLKSGITIEQIKKKYSISPENESKLCK